MNNLKQLKLIVKDNNIISNQDCELLNKLFQTNFKNTLTNLKILIDFCGDMPLTSTGIKQLGQGISSLKYIENLDLDILNFFDLGAESVKFLTQNFSQLERIQYLRFVMGYIEYPEKAIYFLKENLQKMPRNKLKYLEIEIADHNYIFSQGLQALSDSYNNFDKLKELTLTIKSFNFIGYNTFYILSESFKKLKSIQKICLTIDSNNKITDQEFIEFGYVLLNLNQQFSLHQLQINICKTGNNITNESIQEFKELFTEQNDFYLNTF